MNWDAIGAMGEIVGAAAVVASLVYLGTQLRQGTLASQAVAYQALGHGLAEYWAGLCHNPTIAALNMRFCEEEGAEFTEEESAAMVCAAVSNLRYLEVTWRQVGLGLIEPEALDTMGWNSAGNPAFASNMQGIWPRIGPLMSPDFKAYFEAQIGYTES